MNPHGTCRLAIAAWLAKSAGVLAARASSGIHLGHSNSGGLAGRRESESSRPAPDRDCMRSQRCQASRQRAAWRWRRSVGRPLPRRGGGASRPPPSSPPSRRPPRRDAPAVGAPGRGALHVETQVPIRIGGRREHPDQLEVLDHARLSNQVHRSPLRLPFELCVH